MKLAQRIERLHPSPVREILRAAAGREVISLAGGLPDPATFPGLPGVERHRLQYGLTEGDGDLRQAVSDHLASRELACPAERILILHGSQQGLDLVAKLAVQEGTRILCEAPTYVAALQVFRLFGGELEGLPLSPGGPEPSLLRERFQARPPDLAYVIPNFQNPTGVLWGDSEREALAESVEASGCLLVEDDPYGEIWWESRPPRPVCARLREGSWVYLGSFSKSFVPGLRMGFLAASPDLIEPLERLRQATDLHPNRIAQQWVLEDLKDPHREARLGRLRERYAQSAARFGQSLRRWFPEARCHMPGGGLFFWAELAAGRDLRPLAAAALARGVAFLPGEHAFPQEPARGWARLNFSNPSAEAADRGLRMLREVLDG